MYIAKSKIGPREVSDTSHLDQKGNGFVCGWKWSMDKNSLFDESPLETLKHLSTWSFLLFFFSFYSSFFLFFYLSFFSR